MFEHYRLHHVGIICPDLEAADRFMEAVGLREDYRGFVEVQQDIIRSRYPDLPASVVKTQAELHEPSSFLTKALVGTWDAGVHPAQEEGWAESNLGGTQWDDYDVLAALGLLHWGLPSDPTFSSNWEVMARLKTFLGLCEPDSRT